MADKFQRSMKWPGLDDTYYFLPPVSKDDNGKVMTVKNGEWTAGDEQVSFDTEASGETIILDDAADRPLRGLRVFGQTTQATTTGKNLFNSTWVQGSVPSTTGVQVNDTSTICTADYIPVTPKMVYTITRTTAVEFMNVRAYDANKNYVGTGNDKITFVRGEGGSNGNPMNAKSYWTTFQVGDGVYYLKFNDRSNDLSTQYMMVLGEEVPTTYEPYTGGAPSPSPDYPQPLNSVGDDGGVKVGCIGKNLFNGGDLSFKAMVRVQLEYPLPPGTYNIGAVVDSEATDSQTSRVIFLDADGKDNGASQFARGARSVFSITLKKTIHAITFWAGSNSTTSTSKACTWKDIMISRDGESTDYEPYKGQTLTISTPNGLPRVGDVCDEVDLERGVYVQRVGKIAVSTINEVYDDGRVWYAVVRPSAKGNPYSPVASTHFVGTTGKLNAGNVVVTSTGNIQVALVDQTIQTADAWNAWLATQTMPLEIVYTLATPIETPLSAEEIEAYKTLTTHYPTTTIYNDELAEMEVEYVNKNNFDADAVLFRKQTLTDAQKAQILDNIGASSRLQVHDVSVTTSLWVDSTLHADYPYQALMPVNGATSEMCPDVVFDITEALSGNYAPVADAANGGVLIYAKVVPEADIVVPTVTLWK